jgi:hypothetical protein
MNYCIAAADIDWMNYCIAAADTDWMNYCIAAADIDWMNYCIAAADTDWMNYCIAATDTDWKNYCIAAADTDMGVCSYLLRCPSVPCLLPVNNRCVPIKNTFGCSVVVFCACEIIKLFSLMFGVVRAVH